MYPAYDSILELDNYDFIIEQNGKFGYAYFNEKVEIELILPLYDAIITKEYGLSLIKRQETGERWNKRVLSTQSGVWDFTIRTQIALLTAQEG